MANSSIKEARVLCPRCLSIHPFYRKKCQLRQEGHYKRFYCPTCKHEHNHIELRFDKLYSESELKRLIRKMKKDKKFEDE